MNLVDLTYYANTEYTHPGELIAAQWASLGYTGFFQNRAQVTVIKHLSHAARQAVDGVDVIFFRGNNHFARWPFTAHRYIKKAKPHIVLVQGLIYPLQVILLRWQLGRKTVIMVQHHGEQPFKGLKRKLQQLADRCINAYLFTASGNLAPWLDKKIIRDPKKCHEILEGSTAFMPLNKTQARAKLGMNNELVFLWVGRLNQNKDPLTVLRGFEAWLKSGHKAAKLYMVYHGNEMEQELTAMIGSSKALTRSVSLKGAMANAELPLWYSAADFYISGSHREGSGFALVEAMACGCIPVVTDIPSFRQMTGQGSVGFLYQPGNAVHLATLLVRLEGLPHGELSAAVLQHFRAQLSFRAIADKLYEICRQLAPK